MGRQNYLELGSDTGSVVHQYPATMVSDDSVRDR